jgi:hypothetical protein
MVHPALQTCAAGRSLSILYIFSPAAFQQHPPGQPMYALSASFDVNPPGTTPVLTAQQVWQGLVMKAENALPFVPAMEACQIVERYPDGFLRQIKLRGVTMTERITFTPPVEVYFERVDAKGYDGWITNLISDGPHGLLLTFTFAVGFPGAAPGSAEERKQGDAVRDSYISAITSTLQAVRRLVGENKL